MKVDEIKQLIQAVSESKLEELDYQEKDVKLHLSKRPKHHGPGPVPPAPGPIPPQPGMCPPPGPGPKGERDAEEGDTP